MNPGYHNPNEHWYYHWKMTRSENSYKICVYCIVGIVLVLILAVLFSGCSTVKYVPVETVKTEYRHTTDTVWKTDSVFCERETVIREADSSIVASLGLQLKENEKAILILKRELEKQVSMKSEHFVDTVFRTDSVQVPYQVERQPTKWEKVKVDIGGIAIGACLFIIVLAFIGWFIKLR